MKKILLFLILAIFAKDAYSTIRTVCASGCDGTSLASVMSSASNGDTVEIRSDNLVSIQVNMKPRIVLRSQPGYNYTILADSAVAYEYEPLLRCADSVSIENLHMSYQGHPVGGGRYLVTSNNKLRVTFKNCKFSKGEAGSGCYGPAFTRTDNTYDARFLTMSKCTTDNLKLNEGITSTLVSNMIIDSCRLLGGGNIGDSSTIRYSVSLDTTSGSDSYWNFYGGYHKVLYNFIDGGGENNEELSWRYNNTISYNDSIIGNVFYNCSHASIQPKNCRNMVMYKNTFGCGEGIRADYTIYFRDDNVADTSKDMLILENSINRPKLVWQGSNGTSKDITFKRNAFSKPAEIYLNKTSGNTLDSCISASTVYIEGTGMTVNDTLLGRANLLTDTVRMYLKANVASNVFIWPNNNLTGARKYLNNKRSASNISADGYRVLDSIASDFKWKSSWFTGGDSIKCILMDSSSAATWTKRDSQVVRAGQIAQLNRTGATGISTCKFKIVSVGLGEADGLFDTTAVDSVRLSTSYTITYNGNNNTSGTAPAAVTQDSNSTFTVAGKNTLARTNYYFRRWNTASNGSGTSYDTLSTFTLLESRTLYAVWEAYPQFTVTYNGNGNTSGSTPNATTADSGATVTVSGKNTLARNGYVFTGWNTASNGGGTDMDTGSTFAIGSNVTLYAKWRTIITGTSYYIPITVNYSSIAANYTNFPYQVDLSAKYAADATFRSYIDSGANIAVYDSAADIKRPRIVRLDKANNKLFIAFDAPTSTTVNKRFFICVGKSINETNATATFANSNAAHMWGLNNFADDVTTPDAVGSNTGTKTGTVTLGSAGKFGNSGQFARGVSSRINCGDVTELNSVAQFTLEAMLNTDNITSSNWIVSKYLNVNYNIILTVESGRVYCYISNGAGASGYWTISGITANQWFHVVAVYNGAGAANADRLKIFVNGVERSLTFSGTIPATTYNLATYIFNIGSASTSSPTGYIDEVAQYTDQKTVNYALTRYNMFFNTSSLFAINNGISLVSTAKNTINKWQSFKSAFKPAFKQSYK